MQKKLKSWLVTGFKIAIAVVGIWYVIHNVTWVDTATLLPTTGPVGVAQTQPLPGERPLLHNVAITEPVVVQVLGVEKRAGKPDLLAIRFGAQKVHMEVAGEKIYEAVDENLPTKTGQLGLPNELPAVPLWMFEAKGGETVHEGLRTLLGRASSQWYLLVAAWALMLIPFLVTAIRWQHLMRPQGIKMPLSKCLQLTFVGQFYSIMLPGVTGGDAVKIVYTGRLIGSMTKSFITILLDRVIGLAALMVIAGASAGVQVVINQRAGTPDDTLMSVFVMVVAMLAVMAVGATVYFSHRLRALVGIEWFVEHFGGADSEAVRHEKMEHLFRVVNALILILALAGAGVLAWLNWGLQLRWAVHNHVAVLVGISVLGVAAVGAALGLVLHTLLVDLMTPVMRRAVGILVRLDETLHVYRGHFGLLGWAFGISLVSQLMVPISAWLSGRALGMTAPLTHFMAYVPVAVLAASLPIAPPQGIGVLEGLLGHLFATRGSATGNEAVALAQAVRFLPILWNLVGAYWVVTGSYSRHEALEEERKIETEIVGGDEKGAEALGTG